MLLVAYAGPEAAAEALAVLIGGEGDPVKRATVDQQWWVIEMLAEAVPGSDGLFRISIAAAPRAPGGAPSTSWTYSGRPVSHSVSTWSANRSNSPSSCRRHRCRVGES